MTAPILHAHRPAKPAKRPLPQVHILAAGKALCGKPGVELDGTSGHIWVQRNAMAAKLVSCSECRKAAKLPEGRR